MPFNSFPYLLLFLPVVAVVYPLARRYAGQRSAQAWLLLASLVFYASARVSWVPLLIGSIVFNWAIARLLSSRNGEPSGKILLWTGISANLVFLSCFKYVNFFAALLSPFTGRKLVVNDWALPLGISFFTLTQIMYLVDTYQGLNEANSLFDHATLVSFFPYVTAGPLVRSRRIVPQFRNFQLEGTRSLAAARGLYIFALGLAKKMIFADAFAQIVDIGFGSRAGLSALEAWIFSFAYTFQMYFDFSGYSDMALGTAWMLGIDIPQNFNAPYRAKSINEFWQRWHISLSNFITNYLYTPILRSMPKATLTTAGISTVLAMAIVGLWHGPAGTYVLFGFLHGLALAAHQVWKKRKMKMPDWLGWLATFLFVDVTLAIFRSPNIPYAMHFLREMAGGGGLFGAGTLETLRVLTGGFRLFLIMMIPRIALGVYAAFCGPTSSELAKDFRPLRTYGLATAAVMIVCWYFIDGTDLKPFIYRGF